MGSALKVFLLLFLIGNVQAFPDRPIRIIVPLAAGGTGDTLARLVGDELAKSLGGAVIVEDRPGSGGVIGTDAVAKSAPDGHTLLHTSPSHVLNAALRERLPAPCLGALPFSSAPNPGALAEHLHAAVTLMRDVR